MRRRVALAIAMTAAICLGFFGSPAQAQEYTLKIQASWPSGLMAYENLEMLAETVDKVSGGRLKIEHLPAGAIVGAFEVLDATNRGVIDGGHTAAAYWVGKHFAAGLLCCPPAARSEWITTTSWAGCTKAAAWSCTRSSTRTCSTCRSWLFQSCRSAHRPWGGSRTSSAAGMISRA